MLAAPPVRIRFDRRFLRSPFVHAAYRALLTELAVAARLAGAPRAVRRDRRDYHGERRDQTTGRVIAR